MSFTNYTQCMSLLNKNQVVWEFGSGVSTDVFSNRCNSVLSVDYDPVTFTITGPRDNVTY